MTDRRLQELMHDSVADITTVDLAERAWTDARRTARRRQAAALGGVAAAVLAVGVGVRLVGEADVAPAPSTPTSTPSQSSRPSPSQPAPTASTPTSERPRGVRPDAHYRGTPVYWSPRVDQEAQLPWADSPLPRQIDLSAPAPDLSSAPIDRARAAYAVEGADGLHRLVLLAPDGSYRTVDVSRVGQVSDPQGRPVSAYGPTTLSPTGTYLMFPQPHELLVLEIATDRWRSVDPGPGTTVYARWVYDDGIALPQTPEARSARVVRVDGSPGGVTEVAPPRGPLGADATAYGRSRNGPGGDAQAFTGTPDLPVPADTTEPPDVLLVEGDGAVRTSLLVLPFGVGGDTRSRECCSMQFWLDAGSIAYYSRDSSTLLAWRVGTHEFSHVASVTGLGSGETFVSSYSRIWDER